MPYKDRKRMAEYRRKWIADQRLVWVRENGPCSMCGGEDGLQVHHRDRMQKVSHRIWSWSSARRLAELEKCVVVCRSCHQRESEREGSRTPPTHGTMSRYVHGGCRCDLCVARRRAYWKYCHLRRAAREVGITITPQVEDDLRAKAEYPSVPRVVCIESF